MSAETIRGLRFSGLYALGSVLVTLFLMRLAHRVWVRKGREELLRELRGAGDEEMDRALGEYLRNEAKKKQAANRR